MPSLYQTGWIRRCAEFCGSPRSFAVFSGAALSIPFLAIPWLLGDRHIRLLLIQFALSAIGLWIVVFYHAHYAAPLAATLYVLLMLGMRHMRGWRPAGCQLALD